MKNLLFVIVVIILSSCSAAKKAARAEKKALLPYVTVINDLDTSYKAKKKAYAAIFCGTNFPIEVKKERYDSIVYKPVKVMDNTKVNQLRKELERLKLSIPNVNTDSLYQAFYDSVLNDLPECKGYEHYQKSEDTKKDTIGNYHREQNEDALRNENNTLKATNIELNTHIATLNTDINQANKGKDYWKWRCIIACIALIGSWGVYGYFKLRKSLIPKI
jgi:hypothetical protein